MSQNRTKSLLGSIFFIITEEYVGANEELSYLEYLAKQQKKVLLVINSDSPCHIHSNSVVSYYDINKTQKCIIDEMIQLHKRIKKGERF